ncbi:MAG: glycosyltransferase [Bacteroidota bacterium]
MKICFFNTTVAWGGGERWHLDMAKNLEDSSTDVIIAAHQKGVLYQEALSENIPAAGFKLKNLSFLNPLKILSLIRFFKRSNPDVVILNLPRDLKAAGIAAKRAGVKKIIYRRGSAIPIKNSMMNRFLFKKIVTGVIANSNETKNTILKNNSNLIDASKIKVIYNGIDLNKMQNNGTVHNYRNDKNGLIIGNLGRMVEQKGQEDLIYLAKKLLELNVDFHIVLGGDGPRHNELVNLAKTHHVQSFITFPGFVSDVNGFMNSIDIFVLPSRWEGFGYVLVEAMALGKPCIAYNLSSNPEIIHHGKTGWLMPYSDIDAIALKIKKISEKPQMLVSMASDCKNLVRKKFTIEKSAIEVGRYLAMA